MIKTKRQYRFGECIPESKKVYNKLKRKGYNPIMVEGWVEVNKDNNIEADLDFLFYFDIEESYKVNDVNYKNYPKVLHHTWVEVNGHRIDITKNQFDVYSGVKQYYEYERYYYKKGIETILV